MWREDPEEITDRLGWLTVHEVMHERCPELKAFAETCAADGLTHAVLAGMGGSSLAPEVLRATFGVGPGMLELIVLDTTHPDQILAAERALPLDHTLFVIASKSGTTTETLSHLAYFWDKVPDGSRFVAITDPGTPLEALAREQGFRATFLNPPDIGGATRRSRTSAWSQELSSGRIWTVCSSGPARRPTVASPTSRSQTIPGHGSGPRSVRPPWQVATS